ncbi:MAG TPA: chemotaxis protein CheW [Anaeromyxobacteraceae bacterium]
MSEAGRQVLFRAGGERFGLPLEAVREVVIPQPPFARVPRAGAAVRGAMNLRGRVVAVVDLAALVGVGAEPLAGGRGQVLVLDRDRRALGLLVGQVIGVEALGPERAEPPGSMVRGVGRLAGGAVTLLDPDEVARRASTQFGPP